MKNVKSHAKPVFILLLTFLLFFQSMTATYVFSATVVQLPVPLGPTITSVTYTSISLSWTIPSNYIGIKGYYVYRDGKKIASTTKTSYTNNKLIPGRSYTYFITAYDSSGDISNGSTTVKASTMSDLQAPSLPVALEVFSKSYTSIAFSWKASTDNIDIKGYEISSGSKKLGTTSDTYYVCKGLTPGKEYTFFIKAIDIAGNYSISNSLTATTIIDANAPSIPNELKAASISCTEISLIWSPSSDNVKLKNYEIFCEGLKIRTTSKTYYRNKNLAPGKSYTYTIRAIDSVGNISPFGSPLKISTSKDLVPPSKPEGLKISLSSYSSVSLSWSPSFDNIKVEGYQVFCNGVKITTTSKTKYRVKNPPGLGLDTYFVKALDKSDNFSDNSNSASILTHN